MIKVLLPLATLIWGLLISFASLYLIRFLPFHFWSETYRPWQSSSASGCNEIGDCTLTWVQETTFFAFLFSPTLLSFIIGIYAVAKRWTARQIVKRFSIFSAATIIYYFMFFATK